MCPGASPRTRSMLWNLVSKKMVRVRTKPLPLPVQLEKWKSLSSLKKKKKKKRERIKKRKSRGLAGQVEAASPESWVLCGCRGNRPFSCGPTCSGFEERKLPPVSAFAVRLPPGHHLPLSSQPGIIPSEIHINRAAHDGGNRSWWIVITFEICNMSGPWVAAANNEQWQERCNASPDLRGGGGIYCTLAKTLHRIILYLQFDITEFYFLYKMPCGYTPRHVVLTVI